MFVRGFVSAATLLLLQVCGAQAGGQHGVRQRMSCSEVRYYVREVFDRDCRDVCTQPGRNGGPYQRRAPLLNRRARSTELNRERSANSRSEGLAQF